MILHYYGLSFFRMQGNQSDVSVVFDPFDQHSGWRLPKPSADLVLSSDPEAKPSSMSVRAREASTPFFITAPGEYEVKRVFVYGVSVAGCVLYVTGIDDLYVAHLGTLNRTLTEEELDALGRIDVLLLPVGGASVLDPKTAVEVAQQIEPRIIIPMMVKLAGIKTALRPVDDFLKEYGMKDVEREDRFKMLKKDLPAEETKIIVLNPV